MKKVIHFIADDGTQFNSEIECRGHESLCAEIDALLSRLSPCEVRGEGWVQQDKDAVIYVQRALCDIYKRLHPGMSDHHVEWARNADCPAGMTLIGRYVDDSGSAPERKAWGRIQRMDKRFREYEQPYYAIQSDEAA